MCSRFRLRGRVLVPKIWIRAALYPWNELFLLTQSCFGRVLAQCFLIEILEIKSENHLFFEFRREAPNLFIFEICDFLVRKGSGWTEERQERYWMQKCVLIWGGVGSYPFVVGMVMILLAYPTSLTYISDFDHNPNRTFEIRKSINSKFAKREVVVPNV